MPTKNEIDELLAKQNVAVLAVTAPNGAPHAVPTWYEYQDGTIIFHRFSLIFVVRRPTSLRPRNTSIASLVGRQRRFFEYSAKGADFDVHRSNRHAGREMPRLIRADVVRRNIADQLPSKKH